MKPTEDKNYVVTLNVYPFEGHYTQADRAAAAVDLSAHSPQLSVRNGGLHGSLSVCACDKVGARHTAGRAVRESLSKIGRPFGVLSYVETAVDDHPSRF